jgi:glycosyltransferase involved in cell wall biosynthesis
LEADVQQITLEGENLISQFLRPIPLKKLSGEPLVTILMSTFNRAGFLREAVDSIRCQGYRNWELVICDDGSTDDSWDILEQLTRIDKRIKTVRKSNGGQASGLNAAFRSSSGEIICQLDSDDGYFPTKLSQVVAEFTSRNDIGMVVHKILRVDIAGRPQGPMPLHADLPSGWLAPDLLRRGGILYALPPGGGITIRREIAERIFPLEETGPLRNFGDAPFLRLPPLMTKVSSVDECLGFYRRHGGNQSMLKDWPAYFERELAAYDRLWHLQRSYIESVSPDLSALFAPISANLHVLEMRYMQARLTGTPDEILCAYSDMMSLPEMRQQVRVWRWYWKLAPFLPRKTLIATFAALVSPSRAKEYVATGLRFMRNIKLHVIRFRRS